MLVSDLITLSISNLWKRKLRTILTILGAIGAGSIGLLGGIVGILLSYFLGGVINYLVKATETGAQLGITSSICIVPIWLPGLAIVFTVAIGMIAGLVPSIRAMRLSPLAAIRNE